MFGALYSIDGPAAAALREVAADFTPRFELYGEAEVVLDLTGLERLFGKPQDIGTELRRAAAERRLRVRVAIAATCTAARLLALAGRGTSVVVVEPGTEADALASLHVHLLARITKTNTNAPNVSNPTNDSNVSNDSNDPNDLSLTFHRWGIRTLGDLAALPADAVTARLGEHGVRWRRLAHGEDLRPLRPEVPGERFEQALDLEWPIEGLEPLSFVLGRLLDPLAAHLERRGRGAAVLHLRLYLVTRDVHERTLQLPAPMRDARTFRTLLLLDLESHPPSAAIDRVVVAVDPTPARVVQYSLLTRPLPSPEHLSTLMARLAALMGEGRCGSPVCVDSWQPGAFGMTTFNPGSGTRDSGSGTRDSGFGKSGVHSDPGSRIPDPGRSPRVSLRRFRVPVPVRVRAEHDRPMHVTIDRIAWNGSRVPGPESRLCGGRVQASAGPWRSSGGWWTDSDRPRGHGEHPNSSACLRVSGARDQREGGGQWDRDEWDVTLSDGTTYRVFRDRATAAWFLEAVVD